MGRAFWTYTYLGGLGILLVLLNLVFKPLDAQYPDRAIDVAFLCVAGPLLNIPQVRIEQGRLSLSGIAIGVAALMTNPLDATVIGLASSVSVLRRGAFPIVGNAMFSATIAFTGSLLATLLRQDGSLNIVDRLAVLAACF